MFELGQNVALPCEASGQVPPQARHQRQFQGDFAPGCFTGSLCQPHHGHAACAQFTHQLVGPYPLAGSQSQSHHAQVAGAFAGRQRDARAGAGRQQRLPQRRFQRLIFRGQSPQPAFAAVLIERQCLVQQLAQQRDLVSRKYHLTIPATEPLRLTRKAYRERDCDGNNLTPCTRRWQQKPVRGSA